MPSGKGNGAPWGPGQAVASSASSSAPRIHASAGCDDGHSSNTTRFGDWRAGDTLERRLGFKIAHAFGLGGRRNDLRVRLAHQSSLRTAKDPWNRTWTWRESPRSCHKEKPLDVAPRVDPLGPTLLREGAQVGSAVSPRFAAGKSREGGWSGYQPLPFRLACQSDGLRPGAGRGAHRVRARGTSVSRAWELRPPLRCEQATTTARHETALEWTSPRKHRAPTRRKLRMDATDFAVDQRPEVE